MSGDESPTETSEEPGGREETPAMNDRDIKAPEKQPRSPVAELDQLKGVLDDEKRKGEDYLTRLRYLQADFDNYRKRADRELKEMEEFSTTKLVRKLLPIVDELELAIASAEASKGSMSVAEGLRMVLKNLTNTLEGEGLKRIEAIGKPFDPSVHEAVDKVMSKKGTEDVVIEEIRRGFIFRDKVLRPSMVKVELASRPQSRNTGAEGEVSEHEQ